MRKFSLIAAVIVFAFSGATRAQDFTVSELMQLRTSSLSNFETVVMEKGYTLNKSVSIYKVTGGKFTYVE